MADPSSTPPPIYTPTTEPKNPGGGCLKIFGIGCVVVIIIAVILGIYLVKNYKSLTAKVINFGVSEFVKQSPLPDDQKTKVLGHVNRVTKEYEAGNISNDEMRRIAEKLTKSPVFPIAAVYLVDSRYVQPSDMTEDEKAAARIDLQRFARGVIEEKIPLDRLKKVIAPIAAPGAGDQINLKQKVTRQELDSFLANVKTEAAGAKIPNEPFEIDFADELGKTIDEALGQGGG